MQILQWLFRGSDPHHHTPRAAASPGGSRRILSDEEEAKVSELILFARGGAGSSSHGEFADDEREAAAAAEEERSEKTIAILLTRELDSKTWFFSTLHLKHFRNFYGSRRFRRYPSAEAPGGPVSENEMETAMVGCKVLPICHAAFSGSKRSDSGEAAAADGDARRGERRKAISRVKELVRWAAAAKAYRGHGGWKVSYFRGKGNLKDSADGRSPSSGKISLRWEVGSCSTASSVYSARSLSSSSAAAARKDSWVKGLPHAAADQRIPGCDGAYSDCPRSAHWITTDSDFVVLEL